MIDIEIQLIEKHDSYQNNDDFHGEIINLTNNFEKFSPSGGPPSGRLLKRRAVSDGPLRGGLTVSKTRATLETHTLPFRLF